MLPDVYSVRPQMVPRHNWSPGPSTANGVAVDGPPRPTMTAMDGPLCRKWSPCRKPAHGGDKLWLATPFNNTMHGHLLQ